MKRNIGGLCVVWTWVVTGMLGMAVEGSAQTTQTNFWKQITPGPHVFAYFEGRSPCQGIVKMWGLPDRDSCIKIKWQLVLFKDPKTEAPTSYALGGFGSRNPPRTGKWMMSKGTKENAEAVVYHLKEGDGADGKVLLSFMKADENILLFLDEKLDLMVGNENFSYTLNRATLPRK